MAAPKEPKPKQKVTSREIKEAEERGGLRAPVIYQAVRQHGMEELVRPTTSLAWSGMAAGIAITTSVFAKAFLEHYLGDLPGAAVISNLGYCVGFLLVILGRFQLFTENTITVTLPLFVNFNRSNLLNSARVWGVVMVANFVGTFLVAALTVYVGLTTPEKIEAAFKISRKLAENDAWQNLRYGVPAGFLIAALVWINANVESARFWVIVAVTYVISIGGFTHVVAGSTEYFLLVLNGEMGILRATGEGILPTLAGNVIGGTGLFAVIAYAQVREEI